MNALFWFRHDLRLHDNAALLAVIAESQRLLCVYIVDSAWFHPTIYQSQPLGAIRWQFIRESLHDLQKQLEQLRQTLVIRVGHPQTIISELIATHNIQIIGLNHVPATYERHAVDGLQKAHSQKKWVIGDSFMLFTASQLPFAVAALPNSFTPFRQCVESIELLPPATRPLKLPPAIVSSSDSLPALNPPTPSPHVLAFTGGETAGLAQLQYYLHDTHCVSEYKQTRNGLVGENYSSKFSAWLSMGCLSAREIFQEIKKYEAQYTANESSYWMVFELIWRDYFRFIMKKYKHRFFMPNGIKKSGVQTHKHNPALFEKWINGQTGNDFIDANMLELKLSGFMSNRGRQNVASYLCHNLKLDWRYGAAYFEQQLIDYDVCSNWGNWAYVAGVGNDPRENRVFNIEKQANDYDSNKTFRNLWLNKI